MLGSSFLSAPCFSSSDRLNPAALAPSPPFKFSLPAPTEFSSLSCGSSDSELSALPSMTSLLDDSESEFSRESEEAENLKKKKRPRRRGKARAQENGEFPQTGDISCSVLVSFASPYDVRPPSLVQTFLNSSFSALLGRVASLEIFQSVLVNGTEIITPAQENTSNNRNNGTTGNFLSSARLRDSTLISSLASAHPSAGPPVPISLEFSLFPNTAYCPRPGCGNFYFKDRKRRSCIPDALKDNGLDRKLIAIVEKSLVLTKEIILHYQCWRFEPDRKEGQLEQYAKAFLGSLADNPVSSVFSLSSAPMASGASDFLPLLENSLSRCHFLLFDSADQCELFSRHFPVLNDFHDLDFTIQYRSRAWILKVFHSQADFPTAEAGEEENASGRENRRKFKNSSLLLEARRQKECAGNSLKLRPPCNNKKKREKIQARRENSEHEEDEKPQEKRAKLETLADDFVPYSITAPAASTTASSCCSSPSASISSVHAGLLAQAHQQIQDYLAFHNKHFGSG